MSHMCLTADPLKKTERQCHCRAARRRGMIRRGLTGGHDARYCLRGHAPKKLRRLATGIYRCPRCGRTNADRV